MKCERSTISAEACAESTTSDTSRERTWFSWNLTYTKFSKIPPPSIKLFVSTFPSMAANHRARNGLANMGNPGVIMAVVLLTDNHRHSIGQQAVTAAVLAVVLLITPVALLASRRLTALATEQIATGVASLCKKSPQRGREDGDVVLFVPSVVISETRPKRAPAARQW